MFEGQPQVAQWSYQVLVQYYVIIPEASLHPGAHLHLAPASSSQASTSSLYACVICIHFCVCVHLCACQSGLMCRAEVNTSVILDHPPPYIFKVESLANLKFADLDKLVGPSISGILMSLPPQCWASLPNAGATDASHPASGF